MCCVARLLLRRIQLVCDVLQIFTERPQHVRADVTAQDNFAVRCYGDNQVRHLKADFLQPQADKDISLGENAFEGSDDRSTLWQVCVRVAGPNGWPAADLSRVRKETPPGGKHGRRLASHGNSRLWGRVEAAHATAALGKSYRAS